MVKLCALDVIGLFLDPPLVAQQFGHGFFMLAPVEPGEQTLLQVFHGHYINAKCICSWSLTSPLELLLLPCFALYYYLFFVTFSMFFIIEIMAGLGLELTFYIVAYEFLTPHLELIKSPFIAAFSLFWTFYVLTGNFMIWFMTIYCFSRHTLHTTFWLTFGLSSICSPLF